MSELKFHRSALSNTTLDSLIEEYRLQGEALEVNFRERVCWVPYGSRASHMIHLYPAKLLPHIPALFVSNDRLSTPGDLVLDPFCGSGTVLLESLLAGRIPIGADSNPVARLISRVKTKPISTIVLKQSFNRLYKRILDSDSHGTTPDVVNIDHWFHKHVQEELIHIKTNIEKVRRRDIREFFLVAFSNTLRKVSLADPLISVPVKLNAHKHETQSPHYSRVNETLERLENINVYHAFYDQVEKSIELMKGLDGLLGNGESETKIFEDARNLSSQHDSTVQLIVTSPPYGGAQKYIRSSSLSLGWLEYCDSKQLRKFERQSIGREHYGKDEYKEISSCGVPEADELIADIEKISPLRAHITSNYLIEMKHAFTEACRVLKDDGYFTLVIGNNTVCGFEFRTAHYLSYLLRELGLSVELELTDHIKSRGLMTKRNKTAGIIASESVFLFKKVAENVRA